MACATSKALNPVTQWMDPAEFQKMRATMEIRNRCGANIDVAVGYQLADVENAPLNDFEIESYNGPSGWKSSNGVFYPERWDDLFREMEDGEGGYVCPACKKTTGAGDEPMWPMYQHLQSTVGQGSHPSHADMERWGAQ